MQDFSYAAFVMKTCGPSLSEAGLLSMRNKCHRKSGFINLLFTELLVYYGKTQSILWWGGEWGAHDEVCLPSLGLNRSAWPHLNK